MNETIAKEDNISASVMDGNGEVFAEPTFLCRESVGSAHRLFLFGSGLFFGVTPATILEHIRPVHVLPVQSRAFLTDANVTDEFACGTLAYRFLILEKSSPSGFPIIRKKVGENRFSGRTAQCTAM